MGCQLGRHSSAPRVPAAGFTGWAGLPQVCVGGIFSKEDFMEAS